MICVYGVMLCKWGMGKEEWSMMNEEWCMWTWGEKELRMIHCKIDKFEWLNIICINYRHNLFSFHFLADF